MARLKKYSRTEALAKLMKYCAYQERCHSEVEHKLYEWGFNDEESRASIIFDLMQQNFLNEERFVRAYVKGKFEIKKWGRTKIAYELKRKNISPNLIGLALSQINEDAYRKTLVYLLLKKSKLLKEDDSLKRKQKLAEFAFRKGYESDIFWEIINNLNL